MILNNVLEVNQIFLPQFSFDGMVALDATAGNGHDTLLLSRLAGKAGRVIAMDVQEAAIDSTRSLLAAEAEFNNVELVLDSHANAVSYLNGQNLQLAVFNLGYLPGGDKNITTNAEDVITALNDLFPVLLPGGAVFVTVYPGHLPGQKEACLLEEYFSRLPQKQYSVLKSFFINQKNNPPQFFIINKR
jgi:ubiquinone/menaquinone biosynthesis C-methylase UbiE